MSDGNPPTVAGSDSGCDVFDRLAEEFAERCRRGESPSIGEYEARHPEVAEAIRTLLPTVALMEQLKRWSPPARGGEPARPVPERLGEFRVLRELGRGGMGVVYEAVQESLGRHVALKVLPHVLLDARRLHRFRREAQAVARLHHTNIVPIFGVGEHEGLPYYVMPYIRGSGLDLLLETWRRDGAPRGEDRWRRAARVGVQAAEALQYAHEQGVLHRDIKPANLLIDEHQAVWVTDFGLAKLAGRDDLTASGDVIGTLRYLAPEALGGQTDGRGDVYSLGMTLYELLTLNLPFGPLSPSELLRRVGEEQPTRPRKLDPAIPRDLETIVLKAIAREPGHRYPTAGALADDLTCFLEDRPIRARRATPLERIGRWGRRNRASAALTAAALGSLLLAAIVGWAGYASTMRALAGESKRRREAEVATRRAEENEALSLEVFAHLFETLAARDTSIRPPPPGPAARRPMDGPPPRKNPADDGALLQNVLTFYDRFARTNATNPRLQGEAAWAYRRVGALSQRMGRDREAEEAYARAIAMFEGLVAQFPDDPEYRSGLISTSLMADPWSAAPSSLEQLEGRLRRAQLLIDRFGVESPGDADSAEAPVQVQAKLGTVLHRLQRADDAEACYRRAIALAGSLIERSPMPYLARHDRAVTRQALAVLQIERGRIDEARTLLDAAVADLQALATDEPRDSPARPRILAGCYANMAELFRRLGATGRAEEMTARAGEARAVAARRHRPPDPGRKGPRTTRDPP
jgi:tetratricopeptide (TPR) repeat protein/predicted Ser/Thr protein kinase